MHLIIHCLMHSLIQLLIHSLPYLFALNESFFFVLEQLKLVYKLFKSELNNVLNIFLGSLLESYRTIRVHSKKTKGQNKRTKTKGSKQ